MASVPFLALDMNATGVFALPAAERMRRFGNANQVPADQVSAALVAAVAAWLG